eukprot:Gb_34511 [translate_table: standard]
MSRLHLNLVMFEHVLLDYDEPEEIATVTCRWRKGKQPIPTAACAQPKETIYIRICSKMFYSGDLLELIVRKLVSLLEGKCHPCIQSVVRAINDVEGWAGAERSSRLTHQMRNSGLKRAIQPLCWRGDPLYRDIVIPTEAVLVLDCNLCCGITGIKDHG